MTTHPIVPEVLGHATEAAGARELSTFGEELRRLAPGDWQQATAAAGASVGDLVAHLTVGATRLGRAWRRHLDPEPVTLQHPIHDPGTDVEVASDADPGDLLIGYEEAVGELLAALGTCRTDDWTWPVWSPLGGTETLASAARRWVAHHRVHHHDVLEAVGRQPARDGDTEELLTEFVLDALARRGGPVVDPPLHIEFQIGPPGAGTWTLIVDPADSGELPPLWEEIIRPDDRRELHRLERGTPDDARVIVRSDGETLWRAAFGRGAVWDELDVHGDNAAKQQWVRLVEAVVSETTSIGPVQS